MNWTNLCIFLLLVDFVLLLAVLRYWGYYNKHKQNLLTEEERIIYQTQIKPLQNMLKNMFRRTK